MIEVFGTVLLALATLPSPAAVQAGRDPLREVHRTAAIDTRSGRFETAGRNAVREMLAVSEVQSQPRRRDSLWNGVIIGAGLGAVAGLLSGGAIVECSECAGFNVPLTFGLLGAAAGAGLGAGIDALHATSVSPRQPGGRVRLSPVLARGKRGLIGTLRF